MKVFVLLAALSTAAATPSALEVLGEVYEGCLQFGGWGCVKPKVLGYLRAASMDDRYPITEDLAIVSNGRFESNMDEKPAPLEESDDRRKAVRLLMLERLDKFLASHDLQARLPRSLREGQLPLVPEFLTNSIPAEITLPLTEEEVQGRGFVKKVLIPFILGLKFKVTAIIPLAIALIALKTWKAFTLGLLSLVLSAAMVIFKFAKPKVVNYEVYHYPTHPAPPPPMMEHQDHHGYGRSDLAFRAHRK